MGWQDREYNAGREQMNSFFANPAYILQWSVPIYKSPGLYIRLHFWFLLWALFQTIDILRSGAPSYYIPIDLGIYLVAVLLHELGHRIFARTVGGNHWEWVVWPLGGMIPPSSPRTPWATFVANIGGIAVSLPLAILCALAIAFIHGAGAIYSLNLDPFNPLLVTAGYNGALPGVIGVHCLGLMVQACAAITVLNLFPAYWFDGGYIWQSILWPKTGPWKATMITCLAGMICSVPFFFLSMLATNFLGMVIWALLFADCFQRRRALAAAGPGVMEDFGEVSYNYMDSPSPRRKKIKKRWFNNARKKAKAEQAEQARIDAILDKVKEQGIHSLTWFEKRTLKKATERQRKRDLANR